MAICQKVSNCIAHKNIIGAIVKMANFKLLTL
jgi:hypothetical protein